jgi:energy-coupling factor transporter ATPase
VPSHQPECGLESGRERVATELGPLIRLEGVSFAYPAPGGEGERRLALDDISLAVHEGEYVALLGHNGSGKSTLAKLLNGILVPRRGRVFVDGIDTAEAARRPDLLRRLRQTVGLLFQNPDSQLVATIVEDDVAFGPENLGLPRDEIRARLESSLEAVDLVHLRRRPPHHLSAGQRQRVAIAGILAMRPRILVLDEATAMLDPEGRREALAAAWRFHQAGATVVQITHLMEEAVLAQRVVVLEDGKVVLDGTPREVFGQVQRLRALRLDVPQITELAHRLHDRHPWIPANLLTVDEMVETFSRSARAAPRSPLEVAARQPDTPSDKSRQEPDCVRLPNEVVSANSDPVIEVRDLWHTYLVGTPLETAALRGVDFHLRQGEMAGIIGRTGSGKSTLVQHLNGLMRPQRGRVTVAGHDLGDSDLDVRKVRRTVGLVFQFPEQQLFEPTVGDDVAFGPRKLGLSREDVRRRVRDAMELVGLGFEGFKDRYTFGLSGGEMRRVAIAGVLALEPRVLVLDEPTASLDPHGRDELLETLLRLQRERGISIVFVSHNMEDVAELVERIWVLAGGRTLVAGPVREVFRQSETLRQHGLGVPQVTALGQHLAQRGVPVASDLLTVDEADRELRAAIEAAS